MWKAVKTNHKSNWKPKKGEALHNICLFANIKGNDRAQKWNWKISYLKTIFRKPTSTVKRCWWEGRASVGCSRGNANRRRMSGTPLWESLNSGRIRKPFLFMNSHNERQNEKFGKKKEKGRTSLCSIFWHASDYKFPTNNVWVMKRLQVSTLEVLFVNIKKCIGKFSKFSLEASPSTLTALKPFFQPGSLWFEQHVLHYLASKSLINKSFLFSGRNS